MANTFFEFKQFTVHQEHCAMKVCTDACIQGAFTAQYLANRLITVPAILDLGAGTGLLSLMLAQRNPATIKAVELDPGAAQQAAANFAASPWANRLTLTQQDIRKMEPGGSYDFIISNPPFYESALKSGHAQKDQAMHATNLTYRDLLTAIDLQLTPAGEVSILLPYAVFDTFRELALTAGLHLRELLYIRQSVNHGYFRAIGIFGRAATDAVVTEMSVYDGAKMYTPEFRTLLQPYYLYL